MCRDRQGLRAVQNGDSDFWTTLIPQCNTYAMLMGERYSSIGFHACRCMSV